MSPEDVGGKNLVYNFQKALYGIHEALKAFNDLFSSWLVSYGFFQSLVDPGVFTIFYEHLMCKHAVYYMADSIL